MAKNIESTNKSSSWNHKRNDNFTRNLERWKLDLEEGTILHHDIKYKSENNESLEEVKKDINEKIINSLNERLKTNEKIDLSKVEILRDMTKKQISKYDNDQGELTKSYHKRRKKLEWKERDSLEKEMVKSTNNLNDSNIELQKQEDFLTTLISAEIWKCLLSLPEDEAPKIKINFNIWWNSYEIIKCENCKKKKWKQEIKNTINNKEEEIFNYATENNWVTDEDYNNFKNFAYNFILRPFKINEKHDWETIQYYTNSIIKCIQQKDIIKDIRKEYVYRINKKRELDKLCHEVETVQKILENEEKEVITENKEEVIVKGILDDIIDNKGQKDKVNELELLSFINYLNTKWWYEDIIEEYNKMLIDGKKINFNIWTKTKKLECNYNFKNENDFLKISCNILEFLWKSLDECKKETLKNLFKEMNEKSSFKLIYSNPDRLEGILKRNNFNKDGWIYKKGTTEIQWTSRKNIYKNIKTEKDLEKQPIFQKQIRDIIKTQTDERVSSIINVFNNIFGIKLKNPWNTSDKSGTEILKKMLELLVNKINEGINKDNKVSDEDINNEKDIWINSKSKDNYISELFWSRLKFLINSTKYKNLGISLKDLNEFLDTFETLRNQIDLTGDKNTDNYNIENNIEQDIEDWKIIYNTFIRYAKWKEWTYELESISDTNVDIKIKRTLCLKNLFECQELTLNEKFKYVDIISKLGDITDKIKSQAREHDDILKDIFWEKNVITTSASENNENRKKEQELLKNLNKENIVDDFVNKLKKLYGINNTQCEEIKKMQNLSQDNPVKLYIERSIREWILKLGSEYAINYSTWILNFSIIQAWILESAVNNWNGLEVLNYLWFFKCDKWLEIPPKLNDNASFKVTVNGIIEYLYPKNLWCFSNEYPDNKDRHKLNFQEANSLINKKTKNNKFSIWKEDDDFRLVGVHKNGFYMFTKYFSANQHNNKYNKYIDTNITREEKDEFKKCTWTEID